MPFSDLLLGSCTHKISGKVSSLFLLSANVLMLSGFFIKYQKNSPLHPFGWEFLLWKF